MNRRYIDFVPTNKVDKSAEEATKASNTPKKEIDEIDIHKVFAARETKPRAGVTISNHPIKKPVNYSGRFVKAETPKRPIGEDKEVTAAKARKITASKMPVMGKKPVATAKPVAKPAVKATPVPKPVEKKETETLRVPKTTFVNTEKVTKRPLSKNVYQKKIVAPEENTSGPVTIIDKPEKDSRIGLVVTIIITIILGAAAGTVAFLLLPK